MAYLDLSELERVFESSRLWAVERPAPVSFRRADHLGDPSVPLEQSVRDLVASRTGHRPAGPVRLLTHPRYLGFGFNPASFHYCFGPDGTSLEALVVEVTNTPWGERHAYVLDVREGRRPRCEKAFHVSPFMGMEQDYAWTVEPPGRALELGIASLAGTDRVFEAHVALARVEITPASLRRTLLRFPFQTGRLGAGIYAQALRLWLRGVPFHPHPRSLTRPTGESTA